MDWFVLVLVFGFLSFFLLAVVRLSLLKKFANWTGKFVLSLSLFASGYVIILLEFRTFRKRWEKQPLFLSPSRQPHTGDKSIHIFPVADWLESTRSKKNIHTKLKAPSRLQKGKNIYKVIKKKAVELSPLLQVRNSIICFVCVVRKKAMQYTPIPRAIVSSLSSLVGCTSSHLRCWCCEPDMASQRSQQRWQTPPQTSCRTSCLWIWI